MVAPKVKVDILTANFSNVRIAYEAFAKSNLNIDDYALYCYESGQWAWKKCGPKPMNIRKAQRSKLASAKKRLERKRIQEPHLSCDCCHKVFKESELDIVEADGIDFYFCKTCDIDEG